MMDVFIDDPTYLHGDNLSVIHNTQKSESALKKKSNSVVYHVCRESVAMGENLTSWIPSPLNPVDICTKVIAGGTKRANAIDMIVHFVGDSK